jgi:hypothetical protein
MQRVELIDLLMLRSGAVVWIWRGIDQVFP